MAHQNSFTPYSVLLTGDREGAASCFSTLCECVIFSLDRSTQLTTQLVITLTPLQLSSFVVTALTLVHCALSAWLLTVLMNSSVLRSITRRWTMSSWRVTTPLWLGCVWIMMTPTSGSPIKTRASWRTGKVALMSSGWAPTVATSFPSPTLTPYLTRNMERGTDTGKWNQISGSSISYCLHHTAYGVNLCHWYLLQFSDIRGERYWDQL